MLGACQWDTVTGATASRFGRYEVLGALPSATPPREGAEVLIAVDQQTGRKVALRIVPIGGLTHEGLSFFSRELKALARVRHGSIPAIFDVGADPSQLYIAEELVAGMPLDAWLAARKRPWRDIARVFVSVAGALAAVHGAGLVCRELKAGGILVTKDKRVFVTDLGLHAPRSASPAGAAAAAGSPEEAAERPGDARTDQLALCALLFASLFGRSAFKPSDSGGPTWEVVDTANATPAIPTALRSLLERGLARDPAARFPAMALLGTSLHGIVERRRHAPRLVAAALSAALLSLSTGAVVGAWVRSGTPFASIVERLKDECDRVEPTLDGVWDASRDSELRRTLWRSAGPDASLPWLTARRHLDLWAARWKAARLRACTPTPFSTGQSLFDAQQDIRCLGQSRAQLVALLDAVPELGPRRAMIAAHSLADPEACPAQPTTAWLDGIRRAATDASAAKGVELPLRAAYAWSDGNLTASIEHLERAVALRTEDAADEELARTLGNLGYLRGEAGQLDQAVAVLRRAISVRERLGQLDTLDTAQLWHDLGTVLGRRGATVDALAAHQKSLDIEVARLGAESLEAAASLSAVARLERDAQRYEESVNDYRRALSIRRALLGEDSGEVVVSNIELGWALIAAGKPGEAAERFVIAEHVGQRVVGRASRVVARALEGRGVADIARGQAAKAIPALEEALATLERTGSDAGQIARTRWHLATALMAAGTDRERAKRLVLAVRDRLLDEGHADSAEARAVNGWLAALEGTP